MIWIFVLIRIVELIRISKMMRIVELMRNRFVCNVGSCVYMLTVPFWPFERFYSPLRVETDKVLLFLRACIFAVISAGVTDMRTYSFHLCLGLPTLLSAGVTSVRFPSQNVTCFRGSLLLSKTIYKSKSESQSTGKRS